MATSRRVAEQHEDWLNLTAPEPPWFAVPAVRRAFPNGLEPVAPEVLAEHKVLWAGDGAAGAPGARVAADRTDYLDWLLRDALGWATDYLAGDELPPDFADGVTRHDVTIVPTGVFRPRSASPVGLFGDHGGGEAAADGEEPARALVFVLPPGTDPASRPPGDTWPATWIQRAALACRVTGVPLSLVTDGDHLTLVYAARNTATGWGTWRASEFASERVLLDSFASMLHMRRFLAVADADMPEALLAESVAAQSDVTNQLGWQVRRAVELLVNAISRANLDRDGALLAGIRPHEVYEAAVTVMMRIVFLLVAEENELLPADNPHYQALYSVRTLREGLEEERFTAPEALESRSTAWYRLLATSRAVHAGVTHNELVVPGYGGTLFDPDRFPFLEGRAASERPGPGTPIPVTDLDVLSILDALLVLRFRAGSAGTDTRRLSYRQVSVEQVGYIYERLLDHDAVAARAVVLGLTGRRGEEPEVELAVLEAKQLDGDDALAAFLSDDKGKKGGVYVATRRQFERLLADPVAPGVRAELVRACGGDVNLARRVEPFANLLRLDLRERPMVFLPCAVFVTETGSRRDSGTAYTTPDLAAEVAEHALAPLCYSPGPQDTPDTNAWSIRPSSEILDLKVCDPAVGSGAILVAACRYLAERVVEAWRAEGDPRTADLATAADDPGRLEVLVAARRLVAERCCYGVDRNPMAVEMAKLSLWLATLAKDRPFTFLDHALKAGDSLLGTWQFDQLRWLHFDSTEGRRRAERRRYVLPGIVPTDAWKHLDPLVDKALELRAQVRELGTTSTADVERKADLHRRSERAMTALHAIADVLTGAALATAGQANPSRALGQVLEADAERIAAVIDAAGTADEPEAVVAARERARLRLEAGRPDGAPHRNPLHWPLAFPEVFAGERRCFDAMVGNPPFVGGQKITGTAGTDYRNLAVTWIADGAKGSADLVAYFFLHASQLATSFGFLATNTIAQGDTSEVALAQLIDRGWTIHRAVSSTTWPGETTLEIAKVWMTSAPWAGEAVLDGRTVVGIDEMLYPASRSGWRKQRLAENRDQSFIGSYVLGMGFTMGPEEAQALIAKDPRNADVLFPYLGGDDLNESPTQTAPRWVINFFDWPEEKARTYPDCFAIIEELVKPERQRRRPNGSFVLRKPLPQRWWHYAEKRPKLYRTIAAMDRVMAIARLSKPVKPLFVPATQVLSEQTVVFALRDDFHVGALTSDFHYRWVCRQSSTHETRIRYTPSDVFETFPQPRHSADVEAAGKELTEHRTAVMIENDEGLTKTYNRVHDPDDLTPGIVQMRDLHMALDYAVRDAYGWGDLVDLGHGFHEVRGQGVRFTFAPEIADEVLDRLLELNKERYEAEVAAGLHKPHNSSRARRPNGQASLLDDDPAADHDDA